MKPHLTIIPKAPPPEGEPSYDYEWKQRQFIRSRNYAAVHIAGDRSRPVELMDRVRGWWRG